LAKQNSFSLQENLLTQSDSAVKPETVETAKKQFIEPEISTPVDVLEATTFFQAATSGSTN
jgi:uncharacterized radical SAM superfamily Fe-S cluster-containing enzyme